MLIFCKLKGNFLKVQQILQFIWSGRLNPYDLYRDCNSNSELNKARIRVMKFGLAASSSSLFKNNVPMLKQKSMESVLSSFNVSFTSRQFFVFKMLKHRKSDFSSDFTSIIYFKFRKFQTEYEHSVLNDKKFLNLQFLNQLLVILANYFSRWRCTLSE